MISHDAMCPGHPDGEAAPRGRFLIGARRYCLNCAHRLIVGSQQEAARELYLRQVLERAKQS